MRKIYIKRERALACFALAYHCIIGQSLQDHLEWVTSSDRTDLLKFRGPGTIRNGETICLELDEMVRPIFVIAYREHGDLVSEELMIPSGEEDLAYTVETQYDGNRRLSLHLHQDKLPEIREEGGGDEKSQKQEETAACEGKKLAVLFPGIGYTADKPLLYYSRKLAAEMGYEVMSVAYSGFPSDVLGDSGKMTECYRIALAQATEQLSNVTWNVYADILFIGKSVGTSIALWMAVKNPARDRIRLVMYTPVEETFSLPAERAVVFTGTDDPWVGEGDSRIPSICEKRNLPCIVIRGGNHSLETGDTERDLAELQKIMIETRRFISGH